MGPLSLLVSLCLASTAIAQRVEKVELRLQSPGTQYRGPTLLTPQALTLIPPSLLTASPNLRLAPSLVAPPVVPALTLAPAALIPQAVAPAPTMEPALDTLRDFTSPASDAKKDAPGLDTDLQSGRLMFDNGAKSERAPPDIVPAWPAKTGDRVRIAGEDYVLGEKLGQGAGARVYKVAGRPELVIKLVNPAHKDAAAFGFEGKDIAELEQGGVSQSRLLSQSQDGLSLVKEFIAGPTARELLDRGPLTEAQASALGRFAAQLVAAGRSADLKPANLVWQAGKEQWTLIDSGGVRQDSSEDILGYFFIEDWRDRPIDGAAFLGAVRSQLGRGSAQWRKLQKDGPDDPLLERAFQALAEADAQRPQDEVPEFPVEGDQVRVDGVAYTLGKQFSGGINGFAFRVAGQPGLVVKVERKGGLGVGELKGLGLLAKSQVAHAGFVARSLDGRTVVKEFVEGETAEKISKAGPYSQAQLEAFATILVELAAAGISGDLNRGNFIWDAPKSRWVLIDAGALDAAEPWQALERAFTPGQFTMEGGLDMGRFLAALRRRLGRRPETLKLIEQGRPLSRSVRELLDRIAAAR